jgi:hypothetical protein
MVRPPAPPSGPSPTVKISPANQLTTLIKQGQETDMPKQQSTKLNTCRHDDMVACHQEGELA